MKIQVFLILSLLLTIISSCAETWDTDIEKKDECENFEYRCEKSYPQQCLFNQWINIQENCKSLGKDWDCAIFNEEPPKCYDDLCRFEGEINFVPCGPFENQRLRVICRDGRWKPDGLCE